MCDMDGGADGGFDMGTDSDVSEGMDTEVDSDVTGESVFSELDDITEDNEPELMISTELLEETEAEHVDDIEFSDHVNALVETGRLSIEPSVDSVEEISGEEEDVKALTREITQEVRDSYEDDREEVLGNYRESLQNRGVSEEQIEAFVAQERVKMDAEFESDNRGNTSSDIYYAPMDWDAVTESLSGQELADEGLAEGVWSNIGTSEVTEAQETVESAAAGLDMLDASAVSDLDEETADLQGRGEISVLEEEPELISLSDLPDIDENIEMPDGLAEIPADNAVAEEWVEEMEEAGEPWDETKFDVDAVAELGMEWNELEFGNSLETESEESGLGLDTYEEQEGTESVIDVGIMEQEAAGMEEADSSLEAEEGVTEDFEAADEVVSENSGMEMEENIAEEFEAVDEAVNENPNAEIKEVPVNYDEIYEQIEQETLAQGFENIDIYADAERLDSSLENFEESNWENLSLEGQKEALLDLAEYVEEAIGFENPPRIEYYNIPKEGNYGGYDPTTNTLLVNEYMLYNSSEAADTIAHELWHAHQQECADNPQSARDYQYRYNFDNYIPSSLDHEAYENQLVEAEARAFASQFKGRLAEISGRSR